MNQTSHSPSIKRIALILNKGSRRGEQLVEEVKKHFQAREIEIVDLLHPQPEEYTRVITQIAPDVDAFAIGGGDGTMNMSLEGLLKTRKPLIVLPLGTANNLARNLGIPTDLEKACQIDERITLQHVDVASVNGIYFLNVVGLGLSTQINRHVDPKLKRYFGVLAYMYYALKIVMWMRPLTVWLKSDQEEYKIKALQVSVCNGRYYGSGLIASEDASINDASLDLIATRVQKWWKGLSLIPALIKGRHQDKKEILALRSAEFEIRTKRPHSLDVDGDIKTKTPAVFKIHPEKLAILVPYCEPELANKT